MEGARHELSKDKAVELFMMFVGLGYDVAIKYVHSKFYVEIPVTLRGSKSYGKQAEIMNIAVRGGFIAVQTGMTMRIAGR